MNGMKQKVQLTVNLSQKQQVSVKGQLFSHEPPAL